MQKALEEKNIATSSAEVEWIPSNLIELNEEQAQEVLKLVDRLEQDEDVQKELGAWARAASAFEDSRYAKLARFGDNMRDVAVTEGNTRHIDLSLYEQVEATFFG